MYIKELSLTNFRNYETLHLDLSDQINIFQGDNAQGKTNILESIYLCATARSHRTNHEKEVILWGKDEAHIQVYIQKRTLEDRIDFHLQPNGKSVAINRLPITKLGELFGILTVVMFSPEDLQLIKKSPKERRRFLDIELCQIDRLYYHALKQYHKVLKQRNMVLKSYYHTKDTSLLDIWDSQLVGYAKEVIEKRQVFVKELGEIAAVIHQNISGKKEELEVIYQPSATVDEIEDKLKRTRERDLMTQSTSVGPHRDDLNFLINQTDVKTYGSQGQQRTVVLSMKLAELQMMEKYCGEAPILLLDDVLSELDESRQKYLFDYTEHTQTLITCTGIEQSVWNHQKIGKLYKVNEGIVTNLPLKET